ncbi:MAG: non-canonical purine NTP pyrophosphatase, partial [bacterium]
HPPPPPDPAPRHPPGPRARRHVLPPVNRPVDDERRATHAPAGITLLGLNDLPLPPGQSAWPEPAETGTTFEANATIKACAYAEQTRRLCLADDSGLAVDALGGRPGVISSHYCTDGKETGMKRPERDLANNQRLLSELAGIPPHQRTARFVCVMCLAAPKTVATKAGQTHTLGAEVLLRVRGEFTGRIGLPDGPHAVPRGEHGFGYDPLFLVPPDYTRTSAELSPDAKNRLSHRAAAAGLLLDRLRELGMITS